MKDWILTTFFQKERDRILNEAARQGSIDAFRKAHADVLETHQEDVEKRAGELAQGKLAALLTNIDDQMIISLESRTNRILIGGEGVDDGRLANLKSEAQFFIASDLWKVLYETPKKLAEQAMFVDDGKLENQLLKGRAILFMLATQKKIIDTLSTPTNR